MLSRYLNIGDQPRHTHGWRKDRPDHRDVAFSAGLAGVLHAVQLPEAAALTGLPAIRDQLDLGSCVANATLEAYGFVAMRAGKPDPELSRLDLYFKTRVFEGTSPEEDAGCQIRDAMKVAATQGVVTEASWPYDPGLYDVEPPESVLSEAKDHKVQFYYRLTSLRTIKASIVQGFPVVGGFSVPESISSAETVSTGIVHFPNPSEGFVGGHAVLFVGYDDHAGLVKFQNSWGRGWGDHGFGYLDYRYFNDGLADDFWTIRREMV